LAASTSNSGDVTVSTSPTPLAALAERALPVSMICKACGAPIR